MMKQEFMDEAIRLSKVHMEKGAGGPFGCVIVKNDQIIGKGWNSVLSENDPTAHAEICAIREACKFLKHNQLTDCDIYTSCEPCPMCLGAIYWARPNRVFYANSNEDAAKVGFDDSFIYKELKLPMSQRKIPMIQTDNTEALKVFEDWTCKKDKVLY